MVALRLREFYGIRHPGHSWGTSKALTRSPKHNFISTLTPPRVKLADYLDLSQSSGIKPSRDAPGAPLYGKRPDPASARPRIIPRLFPENSCGFLYYYSEAHLFPLEGGIRFRVTPHTSPSSFPHGQDLLAPSGLPWHISLPHIACRSSYAWIAEQLVHEKLVTPEHLLHCRDFFGSVVARFELSTFSKHAGRKVLHMRILKITKPISCKNPGAYTGRLLQGELLTRRNSRGKPGPWAYNIDDHKETVPAFRVLWDAWRSRKR
ncbi:hypothetical protein FB451DRAFT_1550825 [Mycena latifolia]|nr:hypothetical protein FB451DRAFT_1550825 [Mycena latifolia]